MSAFVRTCVKATAYLTVHKYSIRQKELCSLAQLQFVDTIPKDVSPAETSCCSCAGSAAAGHFRTC